MPDVLPEGEDGVDIPAFVLLLDLILNLHQDLALLLEELVDIGENVGL